ncbi:hypothetical protein [Sporomusa aerivorans]|uniref:hypothetical protein n=1 Tax=Sporomusa aerivorans TaxID=204936 RepID=UPI00352A2A7F
MKKRLNQLDKSMKESFKKLINNIHASGHPTVHGDKTGVFFIYPDGRKKYIKKLITTQEN